MALQYFTLIHIAISIAGIASGFGLFGGLIAGRLFPGWAVVFLAATIATSVTGFFFPFHGVTPGIVVGVVSLLTLGVACYALYVRRLNGVWRRAFVITAVMSLYLNVWIDRRSPVSRRSTTAELTVASGGIKTPNQALQQPAGACSFFVACSSLGSRRC